MTGKPAAGQPLPEIEVATVGGGRIRLGGARDGWQLLVVYRGKHCPLCKRYLTTLKELAPQFEAMKTQVVALSADPEEKARTETEELELPFAVGYGLSVDQMKQLGLYVSSPRSEQETDRPFAEPGLFAVRPDGRLQIVDISNAPFSRPDLNSILTGLKFVQEKDYPVRGTA